MTQSSKKFPQIMGILNCTPDSFYDGTVRRGVKFNAPTLIKRGLQMIEEGADWIDVGGESTRPGAEPVDIDEEVKRVVPVIEGIRKKSSIPISVDTTKSKVAILAIKAGARMINDVSGCQRDSEMIAVAKDFEVPIIVMHSRGNPQTMQQLTQYKDVVAEVIVEIKKLVDSALCCGLSPNQILIDPGFGFAKDFKQNVILLKNLSRFKEMGYPVVVGISRKSFIGKILKQDDPNDRLYGSLACAVYAAQQGVDILRVHDVKETRQVVEVIRGISDCRLRT